MRRTKDNAEETRYTLLKTAVEVFNKKGFSATRLEDIATAAGVTRGAIYHHFGNKVELYKAIAIENKNIVNKETNKIFEANEDDPINAIISSFRMILNKLVNDSFFRDFEQLLFKTPLLDELKDVNNQFKDEIKEAIDKIAESFKKGKEKKVIRENADPEAFAVSLISMYLGFIYMSMINNDLLTKKNIDAICDSLLIVLKKE